MKNVKQQAKFLKLKKKIYMHMQLRPRYVSFNIAQSKARFPLGEFVRATRAKTRIQQRDWLPKQRTFSPTNHVAEFLFSLRVARTNSPSGKRA